MSRRAGIGAAFLTLLAGCMAAPGGDAVVEIYRPSLLLTVDQPVVVTWNGEIAADLAPGEFTRCIVPPGPTEIAAVPGFATGAAGTVRARVFDGPSRRFTLSSGELRAVRLLVAPQFASTVTGVDYLATIDDGGGRDPERAGQEQEVAFIEVPCRI